MMDKVYVTGGDRAPKLRKTLVDANGPIDLTGATITFSMKMIDAPNTVIITNASAAVIQTGVDPNFVNKGVVEYSWAANDLNVPGIYLGEFTATFGGLAATFPSPGPDGPNKIYITVGAQIA